VQIRKSRVPKTYLVYCKFENPSDAEAFHQFEFLIQAQSADEAEAKCKERFAALPTDGEKLFEVGTKIYVDYIIEIETVPPEGVLLRWSRHRGELSRIYTSLPLGDGGGTLTSYTIEDPDEEVSEPEPFVVIGAR
jgi:hypothetical protein